MLGPVAFQLYHDHDMNISKCIKLECLVVFEACDMANKPAKFSYRTGQLRP